MRCLQRAHGVPQLSLIHICKTLPAAIHVVTDEPERTVLDMTIREGKNRQIRRMCEAVGLDVILSLIHILCGSLPPPR